MHWTISRLKDWETCPAKYAYSYVSKAPRKSHPAADRGTRIHEELERYLRGEPVVFVEPIAPAWMRLVEGLRTLGAKPEEQWALDDGWNPCGYDAPEMWLRMKIDAHYLTPRRRDRLPELNVIDYKTGRAYPENRDQMEVYALAGFACFDVDTVHTELWYLDGDEPDAKTFTRAQAPKLARKWDQRAGKLLADQTFRATPGRHCGWCPFKAICPSAV